MTVATPSQLKVMVFIFLLYWMKEMTKKTSTSLRSQVYVPLSLHFHFHP